MEELQSGIRFRPAPPSPHFSGLFEYKTVILWFRSSDYLIGGRERTVFDVQKIYSTRDEVEENWTWLPEDQRPQRSGDLKPAFDAFEGLAAADLRWGVVVSNVVNEWLRPWLMRRGYKKQTVDPDVNTYMLQVLGQDRIS